MDLTKQIEDFSNLHLASQLEDSPETRLRRAKSRSRPMAEATTFESPQVQSLGQSRRTMGGEHSHTHTHDLQLSPDLPEIVDERGLEPQPQYRPRYSNRQPSQPRQCSGQDSDTSSSNEENTETSVDDLWLPTPQSSSLCQLLYKKELCIGSHSDVNRFEEITKLKGEQNWRQWKVDFFCTLWSVASIYGRIFSGQAEPPKEPQLLPTSREAVINAAKEDKMAMSQLDELQNSGEMLMITGKDFNDKLVELEVENNRRKNLYQKNTERWNMAIGRSRLFLRKCIGGLPKNSIYRIEDPRECYLLLEAQYGKPSNHCTVFRMKKWTEIRYKGTNPAGYVERFKQAKIKWEECDETVGPTLEMSVFLISIMSIPDFAGFMQNMVFTDMHTLYQRFIQWESVRQF